MRREKERRRDDYYDDDEYDDDFVLGMWLCDLPGLRIKILFNSRTKAEKQEKEVERGS